MDGMTVVSESLSGGLWLLLRPLLFFAAFRLAPAVFVTGVGEVDVRASAVVTGGAGGKLSKTGTVGGGTA